MTWDDPQSYSYTKTHTKMDWGWEFIKRDSRYIAEWKKALAAFKKTPPKQILMPYLFAADVSQYSDSPERFIGTLNLSDPTQVETFVIPHNGALKWGLRYYQNPAAKRLVPANAFTVKMLHRGDTEGQEIDDKITFAAGDHSLVAVIDLKKPLAPQISAINERANETQKILKKILPKLVSRRTEQVGSKDRNLWVIYLRCIDAKKAAIKPALAAKKVFSGAAQTPAIKLAETWKQIRKISAKNYRQFMS